MALQLIITIHRLVHPDTLTPILEFLVKEELLQNRFAWDGSGQK